MGRNMFEIAELGQTIDKREYQARVPDLRMRLVNLQNRLNLADFAVVIVLSGFEGAGRHETLQTLHEWMDPRFVRTHAYGPPSDEEAERPYFWRFWRALPPHGRIGIFFGSWYSGPLLQRFHGTTDDADLDASMRHVNTFEEALVNDGTLILKFWLHLSKQTQIDRVQQLADDADAQWRLQPIDKLLVKRYDEFRHTAERVVRQTNTVRAPWTIVDGANLRHCFLSVGHHLATTLTRRLDNGNTNGGANVDIANSDDSLSNFTAPSILDSLDLTQQLPKERYEKKLKKFQNKLARLTRKASRKGRSTVIVLEGWDAAGKGGIVRRLVAGIDPRTYHIIPVGVPTDEEKARHYLWRFWRQFQRSGRVLIFDRSWYGRILVERVEGFAAESEWQRAYKEINDFEQQLCEHGYVLLKFWLHIDKEEQLQRFNRRQETPFKQHKITDEDWRNRDKWDDYDRAINDMIERCSTEFAPWHLIEANDKRFARIKVLKTVCKALEAEL